MSTIHMSHNFIERSFPFLELLRDVPPRCQNRGARRGSPLPAGGGTSAGLSGGEGPGESCAPTELLSPARDGPRQPGHMHGGRSGRLHGACGRVAACHGQQAVAASSWPTVAARRRDEEEGARGRHRALAVVCQRPWLARGSINSASRGEERASKREPRVRERA